MSDSVCTTVYLNMRNRGTIDEESDAEIQFHDFPIVPTIGSRFCYYAVRDENGNYYGEWNKTRKSIDGIVKNVEFEVDEHGTNSNNFSKTFHIAVYLEGPWPMEERK